MYALFLAPFLFTLALADRHHWKRTSAAIDRTERMHFSIGLKQQNLELLDPELMAVSTPHSPRFGQHYSAQDVATLFAASNTTISTVMDWMMAGGIDSERITVRPGKIWLDAHASLAEIEGLLSTRYSMYEHDTGYKTLACDNFVLPATVSPYVDLILPSTHLALPHRMSDSNNMRRQIKRAPSPSSRSTGAAIGRPNRSNAPKTAPQGFHKALADKVAADGQPNLSNCADVTTPQCLQALYNFASYRQRAVRNNSYGIVEYTPQAYLQSDLDQFFREYRPNITHPKPRVVLIDNAVVQQHDQSFEYNGESDLDLEYAMALADPLRVTLFQVGDEERGASFNNFLDALDGSYCTYQGGDDPYQDSRYPRDEACGTAKATRVISTSYGYNEADFDASYERRQCAEYGKLGMMGVTFLFSSGDYGVAGNGGACMNQNGQLSSNGKKFTPGFPSTCPYVTSVGATQVKENASVLDANPEEACETVIKSGGGFSNNFKMPSYQAKAVRAYYQTSPPAYSASTYNNSRQARGYPDLSANGANYLTVVNGQEGLVYGTSASAPVIGSILSLINDARLAQNKSAIGFINPAIYSDGFASAFHDITQGHNPGCGSQGFEAVPGWDPVTGLGTVNFQKLKQAWLALP